MRLKHVVTSFVLALTLSTSAFAQEGIQQTLERLRPSYPPGDAQAAVYLNAVAWEHRNEGIALLSKPGGHNCNAPSGAFVACDILVNKNTNRGWDVIKGDDAGTPMAPVGDGEDFTGRVFVDPVNPTGDGSSEARPIIAMPLSDLAAQVRGSALCYGRTDDTYWIEHANHAGQFSNGLWYSGWNAYWYARMAPNDTGSADPYLAGRPAPSCGAPPPPQPPTPDPTQGPQGPKGDKGDKGDRGEAANVDLSPLYARLAAIEARLGVLEARPIPASCTVRVFGAFALSCKLQ